MTRRQRTVEAQEYASMIIVSADPSGVQLAAEGIFAWDTVNKHLYINTDGATAWLLIV